MNKKDALPIIIAAVIALAITIIVKLLLPSASSPVERKTVKEISMPEIPLMQKKEKKKQDHFVLFVLKAFKKDEKITLSKLRWEKFPPASIQPYFIAKDHGGTPLNNGADYSNALKMWANTDIPAGVPLIMSMLTKEDPQKKKEEEQKRKAAEAKKKKEAKAKKEEAEFIKKGMRAVTFPIDQRSASSSSILSAGDLVDVLIMEQRGGKTKTHKYKGVKILAIDGVTSSEKNGNKNKNNGDSGGGFLGNVGIINNFATPKNVTLEVHEELVEVMLRQANSSGIVLSIRNQNETTSADDGYEVLGDSGNGDFSNVLGSIMSIGSTVSISSAQLDEAAKRHAEDERTSALMNNIMSMNARETQASSAKFGKKGKFSSGSKYEVVAGKIIGKDGEDADEVSETNIHRKLTVSTIKYDENGNIINGGSQSGASSFERGGGTNSD